MDDKYLIELVSKNTDKFEELYGILPTAIGAVKQGDEGNIFKYTVIALDDLNNNGDLAQFISDIEDKGCKLKLVYIDQELSIKELDIIKEKDNA